MEQVLNYVAERRAVLDKHPLFDWVAQASIPLKDRLMFMPSMITFTMGFRDLNKWVLRYPLATDELQRGINIHTFEDQTHSRLFLQDWRRLGLDERLGWRCGGSFWPRRTRSPAATRSTFCRWQRQIRTIRCCDSRTPR